MFKLINNIWKVDKNKSFMIGDQKSDMLFAKKVESKVICLMKKIYLILLNQKNFINDI